MKYQISTLMALLVLLFISMSSCNTEDSLLAEGQGVILMSLDGVQTRARELFVGDEQIQKVRVLVFINGSIEKNELFTSPDANFNNPFQVEVVAGTKKVYVIANEPEILAAQLASVDKQTELESMLTTTSTILPMPLLMSGVKSGIAVTANQSNMTSISLKRAAAKLSLKFKKETDADVEITSVKLINNTRQTFLLENAKTITGQTYWDYPYSINEDVILGSEPAPIEGSESVYVYENLTNNDKTNATKLEIEALYDNIPTRYSVYINEEILSAAGTGGESPSSSVTSPNDHLYSIKRNYEYRLEGTIKNIGKSDGLSLTTNVLPWDYVQSQVLYDWVYKINPYPTQEEHIYHVSNPTTDKISFTFKLTNPSEASWTANLTNTVDFEITSVNQGLVGDEVTLEIKARQPQNESERTTEFYINTQFSGNIEEIPLIKGSPLVGSGNRIVIKQIKK